MNAPFCMTLQNVAQRHVRWRELLFPSFVESVDLVTLGSVSTAAVALVSAAALVVFGGT